MKIYCCLYILGKESFDKQSSHLGVLGIKKFDPFACVSKVQGCLQVH